MAFLLCVFLRFQNLSLLILAVLLKKNNIICWLWLVHTKNKNIAVGLETAERTCTQDLWQSFSRHRPPRGK